MNSLDSFLIDRVFEPFAHWIQKMIGWTCFSLSRICCLLFITQDSLINFHTATAHQPIDWLGSVFAVLIAIVLFFRTSYIEKECCKSIRKGFRNPARQTDAGDRKFARFVACLILFIFTLVPINHNLLGVTITLLFLSAPAATHFYACTPLPPGQSKARQMWEKFKEKLISTDGSLSPEPS